ncbi:hypothetical protein DSO57_1028481 [Entomophthora muscae]|uniref:Uncharacterized protein n=1 Tax=Entomophthora muscae TaxID=34485 RepID=A0ACC2UAT6_9FUNG|nr:hypothetical protein DSO57_1028481 [Entomophthora muscae]
MPRTHYFLAGIIYFCTNIIILFASICESTTQYSHTFPYLPGSSLITLFTPACSLDLVFCHLTTWISLLAVIEAVRNDNLDAPKSQNMKPELNPEQNPLQTTRLIVSTSPPGPKPLAVLQDSASKPPVQDAKNSPKVPTPDTGGLPGEIDKSPPGNYSKLSQSPREGTEPKEAPNIQINKQKDLKSSHPKAASGRPPVLSATLSSETPDANPPKSRKPNQEVKPGSEG